MGDGNVAFNKCISENHRYAECFNAAVGRKVISPEGLSELDKILSGQGRRFSGSYEKRRDCLKSYGKHAVCAIIGIENQAEVHQAMVLRNYIYDAYSYDAQLNIIRRRHRERKDLKGADYIGGFSGEDRIIPVITVCVYYGGTPWNAPKRLHDLIDFEQFPEQERDFVKQLVNDYSLIVLDVKHMDKDILENMETDLRYLFGILRNSQDKREMKAYMEQNQQELAKMDEDIYSAIAAITNTEFLDQVIHEARNDEGGVNMCKAFEEMIAEGMEMGKKQGEKEEQKHSIQKLILTLREIGVDESIIKEKVILRYQLSPEEVLESLQMPDIL